MRCRVVLDVVRGAVVGAEAAEGGAAAVVKEAAEDDVDVVVEDGVERGAGSGPQATPNTASAAANARDSLRFIAGYDLRVGRQELS